MKRLTWLGDSRASLRAFPPPVQDGIGYSLYRAQLGETPTSAKPLRGLGPGVMEIVSSDPSGTYRAVYTVSIGIRFMLCMPFRRGRKPESPRQGLKSKLSVEGLSS